MGLLNEDIAFHSSIPAPLDITVAVVYSVFGVCSLFGNSTLLYISYKKKNLLKPAEYFIINLAVSDLGLTLSLYPMAITSSFYHRWLYGKTVCSIYAFCGMLFGICSLTTLTLLSMVCFVKVCYPLYALCMVQFMQDYFDVIVCSLFALITPSLFILKDGDWLTSLCGNRNRFNSVHGCLLIACAWVYALLFACSPLAHWGEYGPEPYGTACCIDWRLSNQLSTAQSYTVALFIFCYILPCCAILASYTGILVTVHASRRTMEQHALRPTHMSSIQIVIVKLSVAVCIGFFAAWSPYAVVSMWAAFGHIENIPPMAFAMPAMFAKSSTIYNPIIYLMLRPNFRRMVCSDLGALCQVSMKGCICSQCQVKCCLKPKIRVRLRAVHRQTIHFASSNPPAQPPIVTLKGQSCENSKDVSECFKHSPQIFGVTKPAASGELSQDRDIPVPLMNMQGAKSDCRKEKSFIATSWGKRTLETDNFCINLEMVQRHAKVAWP